jgi:hypothetical protein
MTIPGISSSDQTKLGDVRMGNITITRETPLVAKNALPAFPVVLAIVAFGIGAYLYFRK